MNRNVLLNSYFELWRLYFVYSKVRYWILENAGRRAQANMNIFTSLHPNPPQPHPSIHNARKLGEIYGGAQVAGESSHSCNHDDLRIVTE